MIRLALLLALLPAMASAEGWTLQKQPSRAPGAGLCELHARAEEGAGRLVLSMWDHNRRKSRYRLILFMTPGGRATIPQANGPVELTFAAARRMVLAGELAGSDTAPRFSHDFPTLDAMRSFAAALDGTTLFVAQPNATPHTELLARFEVSQGARAFDRLLSCNFPLR